MKFSMFFLIAAIILAMNVDTLDVQLRGNGTLKGSLTFVQE